VSQRWDPRSAAPGQEPQPRTNNVVYLVVAIVGLFVIAGLAVSASQPRGPVASTPSGIVVDKPNTQGTPTAAPSADKPAAPAPTDAQKQADVQSTLDRWKSAWEAMDFPRYMSFYSPTFTSSEPKPRDLSAWRTWKGAAFASYAFQRVTITDRQIVVSGDTADVTFMQQFNSDSKTDPKGYEDFGIKTMTLVRQTDGTWLITREDWSEAGD
jgi:ketosteroid isomerase-like protein